MNSINLKMSERRKGVVLIRGCFQNFHLVVSVVLVVPQNAFLKKKGVVFKMFFSWFSWFSV